MEEKTIAAAPNLAKHTPAAGTHPTHRRVLPNMSDPQPTFHNAAEAASLPPGSGRTVEIRGRRFALFNVDGVFHAIDDACPHRQAPLGAGSLEGQRVYCPMHGWCFDLTTGDCLSNPEKPVRTYPVRLIDGEVQIGL